MCEEFYDTLDHINLLAFLPEAARVARQGIVTEMRDGIVVIDDDDRIIDVNPTVVETFASDREALLGESVERLLGTDATIPAPGESVVVSGPRTQRYFEVQASPLTGQDGDPIGRTLVMREITDRRRHRQQLEVLNRVLRHNLRNDLTVVKGNIQTATEQVDGPVTQLLKTAQDTTDELLATSETARAVQATLDKTDTHDQQLGTVLGSVIKRARDEYPTATISAPDGEMATVEATDALEDALWELVANACEHAGDSPRVTVGVEHRNDTVEVTIADDGPGIPDYEREVLQAGEETDLEHGSGLGLWLATWVLEAAGGNLAFGVTNGTTARVRLPATASS